MMSEQNLFAELKPITFDGIDPNKPLVIAGPCSAESEEQVMDTVGIGFQRGKRPVLLWQSGLKAVLRFSVQAFGSHAPSRVALKELACVGCFGCTK